MMGQEECHASEKAFHKEVFKANGADPRVFGGFKVDFVEKVVNVFGGTTRDIYDYCPKPSCRN